LQPVYQFPFGQPQSLGYLAVRCVADRKAILQRVDNLFVYFIHVEWSGISRQLRGRFRLLGGLSCSRTSQRCTLINSAALLETTVAKQDFFVKSA
jgi:hypothetical protein